MKTAFFSLLGTMLAIFLIATVFWLVSPAGGSSIDILSTPTPESVYVQVSGSVLTPGLYRLPPNSRVKDVLDAAGGVRPDANIDAINLAARVEDGQHIIIPAAGTPVAQPMPIEPLGATKPAASLTGPVNLNTASSDELQALPGIGETRAGQIIAYREANGGFRSIDEIKAIPGIGDATFDKLKDWIRVD